ncbi:MAG: hypothetical protein SFX74_02170, partial [Fimbriimonadaceae bacterium]|nr:hypothetical protein [Fimbriimonadaceae bacterium]
TSPLARSAEASRVLEQCHDQPALVPTLMEVLDTARDGEPLDALVRALLTTRDGAQALESVARTRPDVAAWRDRNLRVAR